MKRLVIIGCAALLTAAEPPATVTADALGWMSGEWREIKDEQWTEENWTRARGGVLLGTGRSGTGEVAKSFEFMRIAPGDGGVLHFFGSPGGNPAVAFRLMTSGPAEAVFENAAHDYPQRVRYWREGEMLRAETSDINGGKAMRWAYRRVR